jgi:2-polyprenyl-3-methyl-5-hydroxy-6-metoxy-1,4-benzoquinol methylase
VKQEELLENAGDNTHDVVELLVLEEKRRQKVVDIPCGEGAFSKRMLDRQIEVFPADCENLIRIECNNFKVADMNQPLPYEDASMDGVVSIDGIEHIERQFDFIRECRRIVKTDGFLIITTPNISALRSRWRWLLTGFHNKCKAPLNEIAPSPLSHINMVSLPELRYRLETNGFTITRITTNRIKLVSWLYLVLVPFAYVQTVFVFRQWSHGPRQKELNREVLKQLFTIPALFGETLVVKARRKPV